MKLLNSVFAKFVFLFLFFSSSMEIYGMNRFSKVLFAFALGSTAVVSLLLSKGKLKIKHSFSGKQAEDLYTSHFEPSEEVSEVNGVNDLGMQTEYTIVQLPQITGTEPVEEHSSLWGMCKTFVKPCLKKIFPILVERWL